VSQQHSRYLCLRDFALTVGPAASYELGKGTQDIALLGSCSQGEDAVDSSLAFGPSNNEVARLGAVAL